MSPWPVRIWDSMFSSALQWQSKPSEGELEWSKSFDDRHAEEEDLADNLGPARGAPTSAALLEDLAHNFEDSSDWPLVVEWCSSCSITSFNSLALLPSQSTLRPASPHPSCPSSQLHSIARRLLQTVEAVIARAQSCTIWDQDSGHCPVAGSFWGVAWRLLVIHCFIASSTMHSKPISIFTSANTVILK